MLGNNRMMFPISRGCFMKPAVIVSIIVFLCLSHSAMAQIQIGTVERPFELDGLGELYESLHLRKPSPQEREVSHKVQEVHQEDRLATSRHFLLGSLGNRTGGNLSAASPVGCCP
jgi:hypothetical protein